MNLMMVLVILVSKGLEKLSCLTIRDKAEETVVVVPEFQALDVRFLDTPAIAVARCKEVAVKMAELSRKALFQAMDLLKHFDKDKCFEEYIRLYESLINRQNGSV